MIAHFPNLGVAEVLYRHSRAYYDRHHCLPVAFVLSPLALHCLRFTERERLVPDYTGQAERIWGVALRAQEPGVLYFTEGVN